VIFESDISVTKAISLYSEKDSLRILKSCNWDLHVALNTVYENQQFQQQQQFKTSNNARKCNTQHVKALFDKYQGENITYRTRVIEALIASI
jgi:hypothetical protein